MTGPAIQPRALTTPRSAKARGRLASSTLSATAARAAGRKAGSTHPSRIITSAMCQTSDARAIEATRTAVRLTEAMSTGRRPTRSASQPPPIPEPTENSE
jgi:hypothetical protein